MVQVHETRIMPTNSKDRASITTYIPAHQKAEWERHAEEFEMSQSEFVRTMVQAGRKGFGDANPVEPQSSGSNPRGNVEETVLNALENADGLTWEELFETIANDLESELEDTIISLQDEGKLSHRPREGTYHLTATQ